MTEKRFNLFNNLIGWIIFAISAFTYLSTIEPTSSLWDCGEFIAGSDKLEVVHPPGAPFFLMFMHFFTMFSPNAHSVPVIVNGVSAVASAFAVMFLFWTITMLAVKVVFKKEGEISIGQAISVLGAGIVGSLAFNFSDTVWFSAVEGEVYSLSLFFTALVFWLLLKWERRADEPYNLKWLLLIFYLMGLAIGVHLLSLLVLPVVAFVYYFKKTEKVTRRGVFLAFVIGFLILGVVNGAVIRWFPLFASKFELLFVNTFRLPFWSGVLFAIALVTGVFIYFIYRTYKNNKVIIHTALLGVLFILLGFSSYTMVAIRSNSNTPIDYSNPENVFSFISYINREQYGDRPFLYGPDFNAELEKFKKGRMQYRQDKVNHKYVPTTNKLIPKWDKSHYMLFPRMGDTRSDQSDGYRLWSGMSEKQDKPTFAQNLKFFFRYQVGHMYWRYFAWNFIGRQNDEQGYGQIVSGHFMKGNWLSGIKFLDSPRLGSQDNLPYKQKINPAYNRLYFIPFIFGLIGLIFHFRQNKRDAFNLFMLFIITGFLLIVYQNSPPFEPRERDYTLVGSFWAFSAWIGFGVLAIINYIRKYLKENLVAASIIVTLGGIFAVDVLMANEEWDDHDRSHRYTTVDFGVNYLNSCAKDAILFTNGDNDTYPLWYAQEVEGIRDDIRVVNLQLLMTDWYMEQLARKMNNSPAIKFSLKSEQIVEGVRDYLGYFDNPSLNINKNEYYDVQKIVDFMASDNPDAKAMRQSGELSNYYPTKKFRLRVDTAAVVNNGLVPFKMKNRIEKNVDWEFGATMIYKNSLLMLDMLANNLWDRPFYFAITSGSETYLSLQSFFQQEGLAYRLTPVKTIPGESIQGEPGRINSEIMYGNFMNKFKWGNLNDPKCHIESVTRGMCNNYRNIFAQLAQRLIIENKKDSAIKLIDRCLKVIPEDQAPHNINSIQLLQLYYMAGAKEKGLELGKVLSKVYIEELDYYLNLTKSFFRSADDEISRNFAGLQGIEQMAMQAGQKDFAAKISAERQRIEKSLANRGKVFNRQ